MVAEGSYRTTLRIRGMQPFLWTQFLGAFNDNICKIVVTFLAMEAMGVVAGAAAAGAIFILPYLFFSGYAGHVADACSKQRVLVWTKVLEIGAMLLMVPALTLALNGGGVYGLLGVLFLMSLQSTFFSPAKYGLVPEMLTDAHLSRANGLLEMSTFVAIVLGSAVGGEIFEAWRGEPWRTGGLLVLIAVAGTATSLFIPHIGAAAPGRAFAINPWSEIGRGITRIWPDRTLRMTMIGVSFFWFLGALIQLAVLPLGMQELGVGEAASTRLFTALALGIGAGSLAAGRLSGEKVELGLVPIGAFGMGLCSLLLVAALPSYVLTATALVLLGFAGGLFAVPLNALLQQRPAPAEKGRVLATNNVANTVGILAASAAIYALGDAGGFSASQTIAVFGVVTLVSTVYVLSLVPDFFMRFLLWTLTHSVYRIRIQGREHIPTRGPALIIANHMSMIDGALIGASVQRFVRFLVYGPHFRKPGLHWVMKRLHAIPVTGGNKREVLDAIARARAELQAGHVVCIFVEGAVSRTGNLLPFKRGFERIVDGLDVPIVPVYLDGVWGSIFSFKGGKFFWKWPERLPYPVTVAFGRALPATVTAVEARQALLELGAETIGTRRPQTDLLHTEFARVARRHWGSLAMADSTGQKLTYGRALIAALLFAKIIRRRTEGQENVGILLPSTVGGALANIATLAAGRVAVNLNFTIGPEAMGLAIEQAGIRTILTSKKFLDKVGIEPLPSMVYLEELRKEITPIAKILTLLRARLLPVRLLQRQLRAGHRLDSLATIIFSSGSTGIPKGVMITHRNILANIDGLAQIFPVTTEDRFIGVLPFFHSFGLTGTLWFPLLQGSGVAYHPNPIDAKTIGELAEEYRGTMLISTPTFCNSYLRRCTKEQFAHLKYSIVGAEKLREPLATAFEQTFGIGLLEGYGCTEMAPVVSVNRPNVVDGNETQIGTKFGSVGHPIPGVAAKVIDRETGEGPIYGREGLLLVKGPNMMVGYLHQPEKTAEVIRDGWYLTGDIAMMDEDGFIFITDRLSRFSKIGGEMVPHVRIEEAINAALGEACSAVTAIPDASKGERLVAFYTRQDVTPEALWSQLSATDLPKIWLPRRECLIQLEAIPTLGTGKVDLRKLRSLAAERAGAGVPQS